MLSLFLLELYLGFYYQFSDSNGLISSPKSYVPSISGSTSLSLIHVVSSLRFYYSNINWIDTQFSFNGVPDALKSPYGSSYSYDVTTWKSSDYINLLPSSTSPFLYHTYLFYFTVYNRTLSSDEIRQNYQAKLPKSVPTVTSFTQVVQENGIVGDHYSNPAYYLSPIPVADLVIIYLKAKNFDDDPSSPNYVANQTASQQMKLKIFNLPDSNKGLFYDAYTYQILTNNSIVLKDLVTGTYMLRFRPSYGKVSVNNGTYTSFSYMGIGVNSIQSSANATVSLIVSPIVYPPIVNTIGVTSISRKLSTNIALSTSSQIAGAQILAFPQYGDIYRVLQNGTAVLLSSHSNGVVGAPFTLKYLYKGSESSPLSSTIINKDYFSFRLIDSKGHISINATCFINITTSVLAVVLTNPMATQDVLSSVKVSGRDESDLYRNVTIKIISPTSFGKLYNMTSSTNALQANSVLNKFISRNDYATGISLYYQGSKGYFTYPNRTWDLEKKGTKLNIIPDNFTFIAVTSDGSQSAVATQSIAVQNVNDPTEISFQYPLKWSQANMIEINSISDPSSNSNDDLTSAIITGFSVIDIDRDVDIIKVEISSSLGGKITLNVNYINRLIFNHYYLCCSTINSCCQGDGYSDSSMVFFARPSDIQLALNGMKYVSTKPGLDNVNITLYDGSGGKCIDFTNANIKSNGLGSKSIQKGCYVRSISFSVNVVDSNGNSKQQADLIAQQSYALFSIGNVHFTLGLLLLIAAGLVFLSCIRSCCIYFFYPNVNKNGNKLVYSNWWYLGYFFFMCCFCPPKEGEKVVEKKKKKRVYSMWFFIGLWFGLCCLCPPKLEDVDDDGDKLKENPSETSEDDVGSSIDADDDDKIVYFNLSKLQSNSKKLINSGEKVKIRKTLMKSPYERYCMEEELKDCEESNNDGSQSLQHTVISKIGQRPLFIRPKRPTVGEAANRQLNNSSLNPFDDIENGLPKVQPSTPLASALTPTKPLASLLSVRLEHASTPPGLASIPFPTTAKEILGERNYSTTNFMKYSSNAIDDENASDIEPDSSLSSVSPPLSPISSSPTPSPLSTRPSSPSQWTLHETKLMRRTSQSNSSSPRESNDLNLFLAANSYSLPPPPPPSPSSIKINIKLGEAAKLSARSMNPLDTKNKVVLRRPSIKDQQRRRPVITKINKSIKKLPSSATRPSSSIPVPSATRPSSAILLSPTTRPTSITSTPNSSRDIEGYGY